MYVAGVSACCIAQRDALYHNDRAVAGYAGGDPFVLGRFTTQPVVVTAPETF